jgi:hypothetical protein
MCRKSKSCSDLGTNVSLWDKRSPLPPPSWFKDQLLIFVEAAELAAYGDLVGAVMMIGRMRSDEMRHWFVEHGQSSGGHRKKHFQIAVPVVSPENFDVIREPKRFEHQVFMRDNYTCRYCDLQLLSKEVLVAFERVVGTDVFTTTGSNAQQHGAVHAFKIVADHVVPYKLGGRTNLDNLVSACPACNYGKHNYTVEQMDIQDPRNHQPVISTWDGLLHLVPQLKIQKMRHDAHL